MGKILAKKPYEFISCAVNAVQAKQCAAAGSGCSELRKSEVQKS